MMGEAQDWLRADVFSLGVILFELLTGRRPFEGATTAETARLMREEPIPLPEDLAPETPEAIQRVCLKALERSPADRYADAGEMTQDLARYFRGETVAARPTQLAGRFHEYLEQQVLSARLWRKHGLITDRESERLIELLVDLQRPESPWVVDSRRLTLPQVSLYAGGWLILLGVTVGMGLAWDELDRTWLVRGAMFGAVLLMLLGITLRRGGRDLASVVHLMAGATVAPAALWLMLRDTDWLADLKSAPGFAAWVIDTDHTPAGFGGQQLLLVGAVWCTLCALMRWYTKAVSFSWLGAVAAAGTWFAAWVASGLFVSVDDRVQVEVWAQLALWMLAGGAAAIGPVVLLGWAEERAAGRVGPRRRRPRDSGPLLAACLLAIVGGLTGLAWFKPTWFGVPAFFAGASSTMQHALAFMCSGVLQQALSYLLIVRAWRSGSRGANFLRWLVPNHICGALVYLHVDQTGSEGYAAIVWLVTLAAAALGFIGLSVIRQWKPFLFSGLGYLTVAYVRGFVLVDSYFPKAEVVPWARLAWQTALVAGALGLGLLVMLLAWAFPDLRRGVGSIASSTRLSRFRTRAGTKASPRG
jgi:hypothetical protein